jgi:starch synthase
MKILMVCSEFAPWAKTGGLADAVAGLSDALCAGGHDVRVLLPQYSHLPAPRGARHTLDGFGGTGPFRLSELEPQQQAGQARRRRPRPRVFVLDLGEWTADSVYTGDARDAGRFLRLCAAAVAWSAGDAWRPDVIHCHDWHAALVPIFQRLEPRSAAPTVLTLHNVGYQGVFADTVLDDYGFAALGAALPADARTGGATNFLRAGLGAADQVTTVSPTYAREILRPEFGMGLEDVLNARSTDSTTRRSCCATSTTSRRVTPSTTTRARGRCSGSRDFSTGCWRGCWRGWGSGRGWRSRSATFSG